MPRVVGIDPGTLSFDFCGLEDGRPFLASSLPAHVARDPALVLEQLTAALPLDLIAAPSGYGLPLVPVVEATERELALFVLVRPEDRGRPEAVGALRPLIELMRDHRLPAVLLPGVIHLPTVPSHRKVNRVDMGTADKVAVAALGIWDQAGRLGVALDQTAFILIELGGAFTAGLAVWRGTIVDGIGGAGGGLGYRALGTLDGEAAYALGQVSKRTLFTGGAAYVAGDPDLAPEAWVRRAEGDPLRVCVPEPREVLLSGRLAGTATVRDALTARLRAVAPVRALAGFAPDCKAAAQGAALLADGLAGGSHRALVEVLRLREAAGTVLDHLYMRGGDRARREFGA